MTGSWNHVCRLLDWPVISRAGAPASNRPLTSTIKSIRCSVPPQHRQRSGSTSQMRAISLVATTSLPGSVFKHRLRLLAGNGWQLRDVTAG